MTLPYKIPFRKTQQEMVTFVAAALLLRVLTVPRAILAQKPRLQQNSRTGIHPIFLLHVLCP